MLRAPALALALALLTLSAASQGIEWQMSASEDQVNNYAPNPVDGSTDSTATGQAAVSYDVASGLLSWDVSWTGLEDLLSALHVHGPADASRSNATHLWDVFAVEQDVIDAGVDRTTGSTQGGEALVSIVERTSLPPVDPGVVLSYMVQDLAYVNIHSLSFPMGEIRANFVRTAGTLPHTRLQAKCADRNLKNLARIASKRAKELFQCVSRATRGKLAGTAEACVAADPGRAVDKATDKAQRDFQKRCHGFDGDGVPRFPLFAAREHEQVSAAGVDEQIRLLRILFGPDLDALLQGSDEGRCQAGVLRQAQKCERAALAAFRACDASGRKDGSLVDVAGVEGCFTSDPKGKVAMACGEKLRRAIERKCPDGVLGLFVPSSPGPTDVLVNAVGVAVDCQRCRTLGLASGLGLDCETLDDGLDNASCPLDPGAAP